MAAARLRGARSSSSCDARGPGPPPRAGAKQEHAHLPAPPRRGRRPIAGRGRGAGGAGAGPEPPAAGARARAERSGRARSERSPVRVAGPRRHPPRPRRRCRRRRRCPRGMACLMASFSVGTAMVSELILGSRGLILFSRRASTQRPRVLTLTPASGFPGRRPTPTAHVLATWRHGTPGRRRGPHKWTDGFDLVRLRLRGVGPGGLGRTGEGGSLGRRGSHPPASVCGQGWGSGHFSRHPPERRPKETKGELLPERELPGDSLSRTYSGGRSGVPGGRRRASLDTCRPPSCTLVRGGWGHGRSSKVPRGYQLGR